MKTTRRTASYRLLVAASILAALLFCQIPSPSYGQPILQDEQAQAEAPVVGEITIEFIELQNVSRQNILAQIQIREGMPYDQNLVDRSVRSLYQTRLFDFIEARVEEMPGNQVEVIFSVQSKYRIQDIRFVGNDDFSDRRLEKKTEVTAGQVLDERRIRSDRDAILEYYREKGFTQATVEYEIDRNAQTGLGVVEYIIDEGAKLHIEAVEFTGNDAIGSGELKDQMQTSKWKWWLSWLTGSGRFDEKKLQEDLDRLRAYYKDRGYLDVNISESDVSLEYPEEDEIIISIRVDEGRQYRVGDIQVEGNEIFEDFVITRQLRLIPGDVFSPTALDEDRERIIDLYGAVGYLEAFVRPERIPNLETGDIDIVYQIEEGEKFYVESITIEGNDKTKSVVILRELALSPGRVFNTVWMKNSENRLRVTQFFEEVTLAPEPTNIPGRKNLKVSVREGRTGQFQFGAGFSSLENAVVFFELTQGNFDLFNYRSFFQGDGQKFRFRASIGSRSNEVVIAFEEPWVLEQRLAFGTELYRRSVEYTSGYDQLKTGIELYLRKRLFELVTGQLAYRLENAEIENVPRTSPPEFHAEEGSRTISELTFALLRDTRNDLIFTTRGSRLSFTTTWAGLGGQSKYLKFETRNAVFLPTFELGDQVLAVLGRAGTFLSYDKEFISVPVTSLSGQQIGETLVETSVPFFDRFYLGGPNSLRGFDYQDVGPRNPTSVSFESIGGRSYGFGSLEYTVKVAEPLRLAVFYDWGFVNRDDFDFRPGDYNDNWGFGVRLLVLGNPLRLDLGFPLTTSEWVDGAGNRRDNDTGSQFNFSFGTRF